MAQKRSKPDPFADLTWGDLEDWAGSAIVSRGDSYQRDGHVQDLARVTKGKVVAWVLGTHRYATLVEADEGELTSFCSCPYGVDCKHAVATVLEYLEYLKQSKEIPTVTEQDRRFRLLQEGAEEELDEEEWDEHDGDEWDEGYDDEDDDGFSTRLTSRRSRKVTSDDLASFFEQQTKEQLIALLKELAGRYQVVRRALQDRRNLSTGAVSDVVNAVREEIDELVEEPGWRNSWNGEGYTPDYSRVRDRLGALLSKGHADEVVDLGKELLEAGTSHVEMSNDEGETADEIASCLDIVFRALPRSSLSPSEQMLWAIDAELDDEYQLCVGTEGLWQREHAAADWNIVAEKLMSRLENHKAKKSDDSFSRSYRRDRLSDWLISALEHAGRQEEIIPLCEREVEKTGSYVRLVNYLTEAERWEEAERWIRKGIHATQKQWPGIAKQLQTSLREIREKEKDWPSVAALYAEDFFQQPSLSTFQDLQGAAERAGVWPVVRVAAMHYLETGKMPAVTKRTKKGQTMSSWPLPETGLTVSADRRQPSAPMIDTLIDIAIAEKRPDDVIRWYDQRKPRAMSWAYGVSRDNNVAEAIVDTYPDHALAIWKKMAEAQIAQTKPKAYETAAVSLRKVQRTLKKSGRQQEWETYLAGLRQANARKRRLLETLDNLEGRRIIE